MKKSDFFSTIFELSGDSPEPTCRVFLKDGTTFEGIVRLPGGAYRSKHKRAFWMTVNAGSGTCDWVLDTKDVVAVCRKPYG
jgi:hypothetical protein